MLIFPNLSLTLEFPLPQFYHFSSSFFFIFLLLHIFYYFPSSILIFCLLHNYITIPPPSTPPHLFYIFFHPQIHRPHIDPTSTLDSTFFNTASWIEKLYTTTTTFLFFPSTTTTFLLFPLLLLISLFSLEKAIEAKIKAKWPKLNTNEEEEGKQ